MSSGEPHRSQGQFLQPQRALSGPLGSSSVPPQETLLGHCYPPSVIESLQSGSASHRPISPTILRSTLEFGPVAGQGDLTGQAQVSRNTPYSGETGSSSFSSDPGPSPLQSAFPLQGRGDLPSSAFSESGGQPKTVDDQRVRDYSMSPYPIAMGQQAYLPGQVPPTNTNIWPNRSPRPLLSAAAMDHHAQLYSSPAYMAYNAQGNPGHPYYHGRPSTQYLSSQHAQPQLRSPSMPYTYPSSSIAGSPPLPDQPMIPASPNYILNHGDYYLPDTSSIPSNPCSLPVSPQPQPTSIYSSPESSSAPPTTITSASDDQVRVLSSRPRPQCWDHGCNGREFSTFSNLLRHQREKSGAVAKAECPICGAVFTRSTARNIHVSQGKCKSGSAPPGSGGPGAEGRY